MAPLDSRSSLSPAAPSRDDHPTSQNRSDRPSPSFLPPSSSQSRGSSHLATAFQSAFSTASIEPPAAPSRDDHPTSQNRSDWPSPSFLPPSSSQSRGSSHLATAFQSAFSTASIEPPAAPSRDDHPISQNRSHRPSPSFLPPSPE
ncbi:hypothetical protein PGT21_034110 [Puccinia graminis f. sp. tritici]|uniref:Uncharacterized protein n=1 Tax=Puccinia graminis f. sp. tritici TaxID=56615 RepID=A0A5B0MWJ4_PUCGR|nr:hypothetical protein PGT21_034110 [Puccinia graminis f. sp. tritici]